MPLIGPDKVCPSCGQSSSALRRMCEHCGAALAAAVAAAPAPAAAKPAEVDPPVRAQVRLINKNASPAPGANSPGAAAHPLLINKNASPAPGANSPGAGAHPLPPDPPPAPRAPMQKTEPMPPLMAALVQQASVGGAIPSRAPAPRAVERTQPDPRQSPSYPPSVPSVPPAALRRRHGASPMIWMGLAVALTAGAAAIFIAISRANAPEPPVIPQPAPLPTPTPPPTGTAPAPTPPLASDPTTIPAGVPTAPTATLDEAFRTRLKSATVVIKVKRGGKTVSMGSGFFISDDGLIATNHHVIASGAAGTRLGIQLFGAKVDQDAIDCVADDPRRDLALLRLKRVKPPAVLTLHAGPPVPETTPVVVVGHPQGELWSITQGTITGERTMDEQRFYGTDARIEPGNSGGPVTLRSDGQVIGISDWKIRATSLNYAIPVEALIDLVQTTGAFTGRPCNR